jgi:hypothetical protein
MKKQAVLGLLFTFLIACQMEEQPTTLYTSETFSIYPDRVVQGSNVAEVASPTHLVSNYASPASTTFSRLVVFKFSINEKDNELPTGQDHWIVIGDEHESPVLTFGEGPAPVPEDPGTFLPPNYAYTFRVDMSPVLGQMEAQGYYEAYDGTRVAQQDFKGFYLAGNAEPLSWDFVNLDNKGLKLQPTEDPNVYSLTVTLNPYQEAEDLQKEWKLSEDLSQRPRYSSDQPLVDALFNLSLEEAIKNIEPDSTLRTGAKWGGVWTRDVSYSIFLAFAYHEPEVAKTSLRKKVTRGKIVQDTGSGGAWPVSSDRTTWVLAAWEIYKATGDQAWLDEVFPIIKNTLEDDHKTIYEATTGLYSGESSFLDWREQTYPKWMDNRDIFASLNLGTNAVHYQAYHILAEMAQLKGEPFSTYQQRAEMIKKGINDHLWMPEKGYYAQYLYGRHGQLLVSPRYEALGEALAVLFGVADDGQAVSIVGKSPLTEFGATCIYPQIPGIPPYHNNGIWPFVQAYWNLAAAKTGNEAVLNHGLASIYRAAGLFLSNYENMVATTGDFLGTEINSHRMLWSMAGNLAMVHRVFMGMSFETDGLHFQPVVPRAYAGTKTLENFKYRQAMLDITVTGHGTQVQSVKLDGQPIEKAFVPAEMTGRHTLAIELANNPFPQQAFNLVPNQFSLPTVLAAKEPGQLSWQPVKGAVHYRVYKNGTFLETTTATSLAAGEDSFASYQVTAVDEQGQEGFASEPVVFGGLVQTVEIEAYVPPSPLAYSNFSGKGFVETSRAVNPSLGLEVIVQEEGTYLLDFRYSNGSGPWNTDNKCAIRSLSVNGEYVGAVVLPQRGTGEWSDWGFSNSHKVRLKAGKNQVNIHLEAWNHNMNFEVNTAMLDYLRLVKVGE